jgi:predicted MPP superfamily phosphohydrolase
MAGLFILMLSACLGGNVYIYVRGMSAIGHFPPVVKVIFSLVFWLSALSLFAVFFLRHSGMSATGWAHFLFLYSAGWLVFMLYMGLLLLCFDLIGVFGYSFRHSFVVALTLTACLLACGFYRYRHPATQVIPLSLNKSVSDGKTCRIVAVSDIHLGMGTAQGQLEQYVRMINEQKPDLILIAGDLIDNSIIPVRERRMEQTLSKLEARWGVYMAPGNHEYISGIAECEQFLRSTPVRLLRDSIVTLPNGIRLIGRDDRSNPARKPLEQLTRQVDPDAPLIVMDHQPVETEAAIRANVDLLFCGHTHDGQVWPMNLITRLLFDISYGYEKRRNTHIYVSSGLALWGPPFRIGTRSEMTVFNLSFP